MNIPINLFMWGMAILPIVVLLILLIKCQWGATEAAPVEPAKPVVTAKEAIMDIARKRPEWVKEYEEYQERIGFEPYDLKKDKKGVYGWACPELLEHVRSHPFVFSDADTFSKNNCRVYLRTGNV